MLNEKRVPYLSDRQVAERYSVNRISIWRWVKNENFPKPIKLTSGCTRWKLSDIETWEETEEGGLNCL